MPNALPQQLSVLGGENEATWLAQNAKQQQFTAMRMFGIADVEWNEGSPLQPSPGAHSHRFCPACMCLGAHRCGIPWRRGHCSAGAAAHCP